MYLHKGHLRNGRPMVRRKMSSIQERLDDIDFDVDRSIRYHQRRRNFFQRLHRYVMFLVIVLGSAAFASLFGIPEMFGAAVAVLGAADLVFNFSHRARDHEILYRRFVHLLAQVRDSAPSEEALAKLHRLRLEIEADEPPLYYALEAQCYNEATMARGWERANALLKLGFSQRLLMNLFTYSNREFSRRRAISAG